MEARKLKVGFVNYLNTAPFYYSLKMGVVEHNWDIQYHIPQKLNFLLAQGSLDIAFVSSIEYLNPSQDYLILPNLSISAKGKVHSVSLFSTLPLEKLNGKRIAYSKATKTSFALLSILLNHVDITPEKLFVVDSDNWEDEAEAFLMIGNEALLQGRRDFFIYDLGSLWEKYFSLPFVYSLILVRKEVVEDMYVAVNDFYYYLRESLKDTLSGENMEFENYVVDSLANPHINSQKYLGNFRYDLDVDCRQGLQEFFNQYLMLNWKFTKKKLEFFTPIDIIG